MQKISDVKIFGQSKFVRNFNVRKLNDPNFIRALTRVVLECSKIKCPKIFGPKISSPNFFALNVSKQRNLH